MCDILFSSIHVFATIFTNIDDTLPSHRRSKHTLPSSVELCHYDILGLICWGASWEVHTVWCVLLLRQLYQEAFVDDRFASASGPNKQHGYFMGQVGTKEKKLTCCLNGWNNEVWHLVGKNGVSENITSSRSHCDLIILTFAPAGMIFSSFVIESVHTFHCPCPSLWK